MTPEDSLRVAISIREAADKRQRRLQRQRDAMRKLRPPKRQPAVHIGSITYGGTLPNLRRLRRAQELGGMRQFIAVMSILFPVPKR